MHPVELKADPMSANPFEFAPFRELLDAIPREGIDSFAELELRFLAAMSAFDSLRADSLTSGQNQNKGLFFNELIGRLLERCAGVGVAKRGKRRGVLLEKVDVDLCFPSDPAEPPVVIAETKMAGTPQHPGNAGTTPVEGRRASADTAKRVREIALNVIDLKLADAEGGAAPIGDIATWIQQQRPAVFALFGIRLTDHNDHALVIRDAQRLANSYANGVGLALYTARDFATPEGRTDYVAIPPPGGMSIDDALRRLCRQVRAAAH
ncbi:MAG: hypothetical protein QOD07_2041 [Frankiaceae bacterium]|nr:hypothetical protein [Frankiaceae bacterium]